MQIGRVTIEEGASLSTIGRGRASYDSGDGYVFVGNGVLMRLERQHQPVAGRGDAQIPATRFRSLSAAVSPLLAIAQLRWSPKERLPLQQPTRSPWRAMSPTARVISCWRCPRSTSVRMRILQRRQLRPYRLPNGLALNQTVLANLLAGNTGDWRACAGNARAECARCGECVRWRHARCFQGRPPCARYACDLWLRRQR